MIMKTKTLVQVTQNVTDVDKIIKQIYTNYSKEKADIIIDNLICQNIVGLELLYRYKENNFNISRLVNSLNI